MKAFFVAYYYRELYKKIELKLVKNEYVRGYPKWHAIQT
jgi:hypothetical protein